MDVTFVFTLNHNTGNGTIVDISRCMIEQKEMIETVEVLVVAEREREREGRKPGESRVDIAGCKQTDVRGQNRPCTCISMPQ